MENKISKIFTLADNSKYIVVKQAVYKGETYYLLSKINDEETDILNEFKFVKEIVSAEDTFLKEVEDKNILTILIKHFDLMPESVE